MSSITIHKPGLLTTVQDAGRYGYQQYGIPVSGAMDLQSLKCANYLVGNHENEACLELTAVGPEIEFNNDGHIAICGADMCPQINKTEVEMNKTLSVGKGDRLVFRSLKAGFRAYISIAGGIDVPLVMESKSTYLRAKIGGYKGRPLKKGDVLQLGRSNHEVKLKAIPQSEKPVYSENFTARIIPGPEADHFTVKGLANFLNSEYTLTDQCDRMGYRLTGNKIEHKNTSDIISSGVAFGTIQVPSFGDPIIMMADRQTTGGYPRIACVISDDLPYVAQLKPGDKIRFQEINLSNIY